jgi:hypothetical protein
MGTDTELPELLPSRNKDVLAAAIGRRLTEVERQFLLDLPTFLQDERFSAADFFSRNSGPAQFQFDGGPTHTFAVWPSQLSLVLLPNALAYAPEEKIYRLSDVAHAPGDLKSCLGRVCQDVRIWILQEEFDSEEAKEVAVSYVFGDNLELFYCIYLHDDLDSDYLLTGENVSRARVKQCISLAQGGLVEPG